MFRWIVNYYYEAQARIIKRWWSLFSNSSKFSCDVLMFHHVTDTYVDAISTCKRTKDEFRQTLLNRIASGIKFISMDDVKELVCHGGKGKYATVTFDDVPNNFITEAYPILKELKIPFTLFITVSYIEKPGYISKCELIELVKDPLCTVGAHTMTHPQLRKVHNSYEEIVDSKKNLENLIGKEIKYLAYPFGLPSSISYKVTRQAQKAGFELAFGTILISMNEVSSRCRYYLPRMID